MTMPSFCADFSLSNGRLTASHLTACTVATSYGNFTTTCDPVCSGLFFGKLALHTENCPVVHLFSALDSCDSDAIRALPECHTSYWPYVSGIGILLGILFTGFLIYYLETINRRWPARIFHLLSGWRLQRRARAVAPGADSAAAPSATPPPRRPVTPLPLVLCMLFLIILSTDACDFTFYQQGTASICNEQGCSTTHPLTFKLHTGMTACFQSPDNTSTTSITFLNSTSILNARYQYDTSLFLAKSQHSRNCVAAAACSALTCHQAAAASLHAKYSPSVSLKNCIIRPSESDWCFHMTICDSALLELSPNVTEAFPFIPIYRTLTSSNLYYLRITYNDTTTRYLSLSDTSDNNDLSILATSGYAPIIFPFFALYKNKAYNIDACAANSPQLGRIGEFQVYRPSPTSPLDGMTYPISLLNRHPIDDSPGWIIPPQALDRGFFSPRARLGLARFSVLELTHSRATAIFSHSLPRAVTFLLQSPTLLRELFASPHCSLTLLSGIACTGCSLPTQFHVQAHDVTTPGLLFFNSNCQFDRNSISCDNSQPTVLTCIGSCNMPCNLTSIDGSRFLASMATPELDLGSIESYSSLEADYEPSEYVAPFATTSFGWLYKTVAAGLGAYATLRAVLFLYLLKSTCQLVNTNRPA